MLIFDYDYCIAHYLSQNKANIQYSCFFISINKDISFEKN